MGKYRNKEEEVKIKSREIALKLNLSMKISDVEFQADGKKAIFYYTASDRVDFRKLIIDLAREFSIKVEMKQIGLREEASRLGRNWILWKRIMLLNLANRFQSSYYISSKIPTVIIKSSKNCWSMW